MLITIYLTIKQLYSIINHKLWHESWRAIVPSIANKSNFGRLRELIQIKHNTSKTECTRHHIETTLLKLSVATTPRSSVLMSFLTFSWTIHYNSIIQFSHFTWLQCFTNVSEQYSWYVFRPPLSVLWSSGSVRSHLWSISNFENLNDTWRRALCFPNYIAEPVSKNETGLGCLSFLNRNDIPSESIKQADQGIIHRFHHVSSAGNVPFLWLEFKKTREPFKIKRKELAEFEINQNSL